MPTYMKVIFTTWIVAVVIAVILAAYYGSPKLAPVMVALYVKAILTGTLVVVGSFIVFLLIWAVWNA